MSSLDCRRCDFTAKDADERAEHARDTRHPLCICCYQSLPIDDSQTCNRCIGNTRADLADIVEAVTLAPEVIEAGGYRGILVDLLAYVADGAIESPRQQLEPELYAGAEWRSDPWPVLAVLEGIERTWRLEFEHGPGVNVATITGCADYLNKWVERAAHTFAGFDDDATTLRTLAIRLRHATGTSDDPETGVECLDCPGVKLERVYRAPVLPVPDYRRSRDGQRGLEQEGKADTYACPWCRREYDWRDYGKAVHHYAAGIEGWVKVSDGATAVGRDAALVWRWIREGRIAVACLLVNKDRRARVPIDDLRTLSAATHRKANNATLLDFAAAG